MHRPGTCAMLAGEGRIMNIGTIACLIFAGLFAAVAGVFALLGPKGALLVSGFQSIPKERRQTYDMDKLSRDQRRALLLWAALWLSGALLCQLAGPRMSFLAGVLWLAVFLRDVHGDAERAFAKYRKDTRNSSQGRS